MIDLGQIVIAQEANAIVTIKPKGAGSYDPSGIWTSVRGDDIPDIACVIQPATGRRLLDLPEGVRAEARYFLWMQEDLALDDVVFYGGQRYRVVFVWPRQVEANYTRAAIGLNTKANS